MLQPLPQRLDPDISQDLSSGVVENCSSGNSLNIALPEDGLPASIPEPHIAFRSWLICRLAAYVLLTFSLLPFIQSLLLWALSLSSYTVPLGRSFLVYPPFPVLCHLTFYEVSVFAHLLDFYPRSNVLLSPFSSPDEGAGL